jgi:hypothetical protein
MSGKQGMRHYPKIIKEEIKEKQKTGQSVNSLSREYGISRYAIQSWCGLRPEKEIVSAEPRRRGRPRKNKILTEKEKDNEIKRLTMENDLLRSFLQIAGRR